MLHVINAKLGVRRRVSFVFCGVARCGCIVWSFFSVLFIINYTFLKGAAAADRMKRSSIAVNADQHEENKKRVHVPINGPTSRDQRRMDDDDDDDGGLSLWCTKGNVTTTANEEDDKTVEYTTAAPTMIAPHRITKNNMLVFLSGNGQGKTKQTSVKMLRNGSLFIDNTLTCKAPSGRHQLTTMNGKVKLDGVVVYPPHLADSRLETTRTAFRP